ncbi:lipocalin [Bizionia argentinensis JUB59]|uniref:Lipocalin n=1 Tax=Bizionia argentinensis JUB59 TaxID=1046627 RepID=G2ED01_9FLAO|nr:lipocalin family protein [Bizionia argentinensis]EGV43738.1 lipocalin [Bizionia argentinensis JUB59]
MRNLIVLLLTLSMLSCGTSKVVRDSRKDLKGSWTLNSFNYSKTGSFKVDLFNDASTDCFEGSTWEFIPNNSSGTYEITNSNCATGPRNFKFQIDEIDQATGLYDFLIKPTSAKGKSEYNQGYRLKLAGITETTMQWRQTVTLDGSPFTIFMNFTKQ